MKNDDIQQLIDRFMDGTTTLDEERRLADYFRTAEPAEQWSDDWMAYKEMFAYFDEGMPTGDNEMSTYDNGMATDAEKSLEQKTLSLVATHNHRNVVLRIAATAAAVVVLAGVGLHFSRQLREKNGSQAALSVTIADRMPTEASDTTSVSVPATHENKTVERKSKGRSVKQPTESSMKYRFSPAPPKRYYAENDLQTLTDSISPSAKLLAEEKLREVEMAQYEFINSLNENSREAIAVLEVIEEEDERN